MNIDDFKRMTSGAEDIVDARLDGSHFEHWKFDEQNLTGANLEDAHLQHCSFYKTNMRYANMRRADMRNSSLRKTVLYRAQLDNVDFRGSHMQGADLSEASLKGADLRNVDLMNANLEHAVFENTLYDDDTVFPRFFEIGKGLVLGNPDLFEGEEPVAYPDKKQSKYHNLDNNVEPNPQEKHDDADGSRTGSYSVGEQKKGKISQLLPFTSTNEDTVQIIVGENTMLVKKGTQVTLNGMTIIV